MSHLKSVLVKALAACLALVGLAAATNSASASVTIFAENRLVEAVQDNGGLDGVQDSDGIGGVFAESASIEVLSTGSNGFGSLFAEQNTSLGALNWSGTGGVAIDGHVPLRPISEFGGHARSGFLVVFEVTCPTMFTLEGTLSELVDGGDAFASFRLNKFVGSDLFEITSTGGADVNVSESTLLAPGAYVFTAQAFADGDPGTNFFDRANFQFDVELEEQCVVPEPGSVAAWSLMGLTFFGANAWRRRVRPNG